MHLVMQNLKGKLCFVSSQCLWKETLCERDVHWLGGCYGSGSNPLSIATGKETWEKNV